MLDIAEQICLAVDEIVTERLRSINYDTTIVATIVDNTHAKDYYYICSNGSSQFIAYSKDTTYEINESVQVTIPNNDYDQQKIIIGKYVSKDAKPFVFTQPFSTIIDVSSNLINDNTEVISAGLLANDNYDVNVIPDENGKYPITTKEIPLWSKVFEEGYADFNRLGIQGQFRSWLASLKPIAGNYGYRLEVLSNNGSIIESENLSADWIKLYDKILKGEENINLEILDITPDSWYDKLKEKLELKPEDGKTCKQDFIEKFKVAPIKTKKNMIYAILSINMQITEIYLDSMEDMYGNPFNFQSFFEQEKVYDISNLGTIYGMALFFYEKSATFYSEDENYLKYKTITGTKIPPNLFTKDPYICLGYDLSAFNSEQAILYSLDGKTYIVKDEIDQTLNKKTIRLRWLHEFENGQIKVVSEASNLEGYEIRWYRFKMGAPSADEYSGVYWRRVKPSDISQFMYILEPEMNTASEQIKVIILYEGKVIRSNIIEFVNEKEVANSATIEVMAGLSIWCLDNSYGNYYIYGQNNNLFNESKANEILTLQARFTDVSILAEEYDIDKVSAPLTEAKEIIWEFPLKNTMIAVHGFNYGFESALKNKEWYSKILDNEGKIQYNLIKEYDNSGEVYKLNGYYSNAIIQLKDNIICIIRKGNENNEIINSQEYRINKTYSANKINNTVKCSIKKNGLVYSAVKELGFGLMGTNGTDATVVIDFNDNKVALTAGIEESFKITARLYDYNHKEIDFNNSDLGLTCEWSWYKNYQVDNCIDNINPGLSDEDREKAIANCYNISIVKIEQDIDTQNICYLNHNTDLKMNQFLIIQATIKGWGDYDLTALKAIPIRATSNYRAAIGPTEVIYNSSGYIDYYKGPYELYYAEKVNEYDAVPSDTAIIKIDSNWQIYDPYYTETELNKYVGAIDKGTNILRPAAVHFEDVEPYGAICYINKEPVWIQPLVIIKNQYPSSTLNRWNGKSIEINKNEGYIIAPAIAAGKKHSDDNTFSGVMIGDWSEIDSNKGGTAQDIAVQTGVYGFNHGAMAYALKEDGTAFIGKNGRGRIYFDGNDAKIYSATYNTANIGMMIDLGGDDESPYIDIKTPSSSILLKAEEGASQIYFSGSGGEIIISSDAYSNPLTIGTKFEVDWEGNLTANNAYLKDAYLENVYASGELVGNKGVIGGWKIDGQLLQGGTTTFNKDGTYTWIPANPAIYLDAPNAAICGGNLKPSIGSSNYHVMNLWGYLQVCDSSGSPINGGNYFGYINSGMPGVDGDGIGLSMKSIGSIKLTTANIGLNYLPSGTFLSLSDSGINLTSGSPERLGIAFYGSNITLDTTQFKIYNIPATQQEGIYARFA